MLKFVFKVLLPSVAVIGSSLVYAELIVVAGLMLATLYRGTVRIVLEHGHERPSQSVPSLTRLGRR